MVGKRALIVKFGQIGDVIMAIPGVFALHQQGYEIDWLCGIAARPLLECYSWIRAIPVDDAAILRGTLIVRAREIGRLWARVFPTKYDVVATLYFDKRFHLLALPFRATRRITLSRGTRANALLAGRHHTDEFLRVLIQRADSCKEESCPPLRPDRLPVYRWQDISRRRRIAIVPGGTRNVLGEQSLRRWPIEHYTLFARVLLERGWEVVLFGGPDDAWVKSHFSDLPVHDYTGKLSLPELVSAFDGCDAVVTHDTGPLHVAGLSDTGLIGIFGPTDPATRIPRRPYSVGIWGGQGFACRPCYDGRDFAPCTFNGCMHQVTPELVLRELDRLLSDRDQDLKTPWRIAVPEETTSRPVSIAPGVK